MHFSRTHAALFFCLVLEASLIYSPYLLSASMLALGAICFFDWQISRWEKEAVPKLPGIRFRLGQLSVCLFWKKEFWMRCRAFLQNPVLQAISIFFWVVFVSGLWSEDFSEWLRQIRMRVPFLGLPLIWAHLPPFSERQRNGLLYALVWLLFLTCIGIGLNFWMHYDDIMQKIGQGQAVPTPRNHIRFSLLLAFGIVAGGYLAWKQFSMRWAWEPKVLWAVTGFLLVFIHFLSVRSGFAALYAALLFTGLRFIGQTWRWMVGLAGLILLLGLPVAAYYTVPSFALKVNYALWDMGKFRLGEKDKHLYADSGRMASLAAGWDIAKQNPWFGVGAGDLEKETAQYFDTNFPQFDKPLLPHNQWLFIFAGTGIFGLAASALAFFFPLFFRKNYRAYLLAAFCCIVFTSFLAEYTLETSIGVAFYLYFLLLLLPRQGD